MPDTTKMQTQIIFGTPLTVFQNAYHASDTEIDFILDLPRKSHDGGVQMTDDTHILIAPELSEIKDIIDEKAAIFRTDVLGISNEIKMVHSWSTVITKDKAHRAHNHKGALFAVVLYLRVPEGSGNLVLREERCALDKGLDLDYNITNHNSFNCKITGVEVVEGMVAMFPAWVRHGTMSSTTDKLRITIGANFFVAGKVGKNNIATSVTVGDWE